MAHFRYADTSILLISSPSCGGFIVKFKLLSDFRHIFVQNPVCFALPMDGQHMGCILTVGGLCGLHSFSVFSDRHALICLNSGM